MICHIFETKYIKSSIQWEFWGIRKTATVSNIRNYFSFEHEVFLRNFFYLSLSGLQSQLNSRVLSQQARRSYSVCLTYSHQYLTSRESDTRFSTSDFFHKSVSPGPLSMPIGPFRFFSKIRERMFISGGNDTGGKKFWNKFFFHILLRALFSALYT